MGELKLWGCGLCGAAVPESFRNTHNDWHKAHGEATNQALGDYSLLGDLHTHS